MADYQKKTKFDYKTRFSDLRYTARESKETIGKPYKKIKPGEHIESNSAKGIFRADIFLKKGDYPKAYFDLKQAYENVLEDPVEERREGYIQAIQKRLQKISDDVLIKGKGQKPHRAYVGDEYFGQEAKELNKQIERNRKNRGGLEKTAEFGFVFLLITSLFLLSSNITGFAINNSSKLVNNRWGIFLFLGSLGLLFFVLKNKI